MTGSSPGHYSYYRLKTNFVLFVFKNTIWSTESDHRHTLAAMAMS